MKLCNRAALLASLAALTACESAPPALPSGAAALSRDAAAKVSAQPVREYLIGPLDTIAINVFQEPDLSVKDVQVDASGNILFPLIGSVRASGKTTSELSAEIADRLRLYLTNPQISVLVQTSVSQTVTVEGSVTEPGVYEMKGPIRLLDAIAMAKGTTRVASLRDVVLLREVDGKPAGALFNVRKIQRGEMENPEILGNDTVVVGLSNVKAAWRDILTTAPLIAVFRPFR